MNTIYDISRFPSDILKKECFFLKGLIGLIRFFINLLIIIFVGYVLNSYIFGIVINIEKNLDNPKKLDVLVSNLPHQMSILFLLGVVVTIIIYLVHTVFVNYLVKYFNKLI